MNEEQLWAIVINSAREARHTGSVSGLLSIAGESRILPTDTVMERLERKVTVADALYADYDAEWRPVRDNGLATDMVAAGLAALFLLNALSTASLGLSLKRLNAADVLIRGREKSTLEPLTEMQAHVQAASLQLLEANQG